MKELYLVSALPSLFLVSASVSVACRCPEVSSTRISYKRAQAIVVGGVLKLASTPDRTGRIAIISVTQAWKRSVPNRIAVTTHTTCVFTFATNQSYLLYLYTTNGQSYIARMMRLVSAVRAYL
jgi:hypothetical protein